ncbi:uncharacterized protein LOC110704893 isoform X2 [Chenopodium quinoa]|uniref:uncharacterized protein LOC110704893 isoform X2 n=1 Tax=Chenopodium quinoa TaxID=63459 RepID=UPI000B779FF0|nr:uncharacterized protein LOC110704893 isoform X2 [Chenopodium quinoa]
MQDAMKMKEAGTKSRIECNNSKAKYENMLKILERYMQGKLEGKPAKIFNTEVEKRLEMMRKLLVQNVGIDNLEFQEINCKDFKFFNENEMYSNIKQKNASEAINVLHLPVEGELYKQSDDKNDDSTSVTDEFVSMLSEAYKNKSDLHFIPAMTFNKIVAARLVLLDEIKNKIASDEETLAEKMKGRSDLFDVKMESSLSSNVALEGNSEVVLKLNQALEPQTENDEVSSQGTQVDSRKLKPGWLEKFIKKTFFEPCSEHPIRRNELNKYCIDCDTSLCQYCVSLASHSGHRILKIYRHVYKDVVPLDEIERRIDCSKIQPYRCNRQLVVALTPLPHSGAKTNEEAACQTCRRRLIEYELYDYCSISCKVGAFLKKQNDFDPPFLLLDQVEEKIEQVQISSVSAPPSPVPTKIVTKTRKRKGTPYRAPLS